MAFDENGVIGLLGPNGAGKTTLMRILTGYLNQWEGEVLIGTFDLREQPKNIQQQIGYLPENNPLYPEMYVKEYLKFVGDLYGLKRPPFEKVIEKTGLAEHIHKKIEILSKGYKQRVGLAATLLHDPQYPNDIHHLQMTPITQIPIVIQMASISFLLISFARKQFHIVVSLPKFCQAN